MDTEDNEAEAMTGAKKEARGTEVLIVESSTSVYLLGQPVSPFFSLF